MNIYPVTNRDHRYGAVTDKGDVVIDFRYDYLGGASAEKSMVAEIGNKKGLIGIHEDWLCEFDSWESSIFSDNALPVHSDGTPGFINPKGEWIIRSDEFNDIWEFSEGMAGVQVGAKVGFINPDGAWAINPDEKFQGGNFSDGRLPIVNNGRLGFIDKEGKTVIGPKFDDQPSSFFTNSYAPVWNEGWAFLIDKKGTPVTNNYHFISHPSEGIAKISNDPELNIINFLKIDDNSILGDGYDYVSNFSNGLAMAIRNRQGEILDVNGLTAHVDGISDCGDYLGGRFVARAINDKCGLLDSDGVWIVSPELIRIDYLGGKVWSFLGNESHGLIDSNGDVIWSAA